MGADVPLSESIGASLLSYEPEKYWAIWQIPEERYAYVVEFELKAWLIAIDSEEAGIACLLADAAMNDRPPSAYRLDQLTLPDLFAAARAQGVPFLSSQGIPVVGVLGVELRTGDAGESWALRRIPL